MANTTVSKITISKDNANLLINNIRDELKVLNKGYLSIAPDLQKLYDTKAYEVLGYKNFDELCDNVFDMSHGTSVGIRKVFGLFGTKKDGAYSIPQKYLEYGYTKLLYIAQDWNKFKDANIAPFEVFTPDMTLASMKATLTNALIDKAKIQDETAIDTTATDVITSSTETPSTEEPSTEEPKSLSDYATNPKAYCDDIIKDMQELNKLLKDSVKPEKLALLDGAIAYLKDLKKSIK